MKKNLKDGLYAAFDLGTVSLKATIIEVKGSRPRLAAIEEDNLKPLSDFPGDDEFRTHQMETLQNLSSRLPLKECQQVAVLFSNREMQIKVIELPSQVQADQIEKILTWEAKKLLSPTSREEPYSFSYKVVKESPYTVALAVIPQRFLEKHMELFEQAGINVDAAYAEVFAAHSLKDAVDHTGLPALSIVNFGHSGTHLQIFSAGELRFYRFIPSGMAEMSEPPQESELEMYSQKIRFSFDYFRAVSKLSQIDAVFFMGGGAAQANMLPYQRNYFNPTRVNIVDVSSYLDISPILPEIADNAPAEEKQRRLLPFLPAVGAILTLFSEDSSQMNFALRLKKKNREKRIKELAKTLPAFIGVIGLLIIAVAIFYLKNNLADKKKELNKKLDIAKINVEAINLKIAKYKAAADIGMKLSPAARRALRPVFAPQQTQASILFFIASGKQPGLSVSDILIRNAAEAESIQLESQQSEQAFYGSGSEMSADEDSNPFLSKITGQAGDSEQYREGLGGKVLVIKGITRDNEALAKFSEFLAKKKAIKRLKTVVSRKKSNRELEFLIKGEMP
jgi:Tfp pilus assembly PilM family ATPase